MELIVLDTSLKMLSVLDTFESLIWTERYSAYGDFEVYTSINDSILEILKDDYYLWLKESDQTMIVEDRKIESDAENGNHFTVTGRSLESILERRIIWKQTILSGNFQNGIKKLLDENIINPSDASRKVERLIFEASTDPAITGLTVDAQFTGDNLYDAIKKLCDSKNIGFRIKLSDDNKFVFKLYAGADRSYDQFTNPYVIFSPKFENVINTNYLESKKTLKTVTLVAGEGEGADRKTTTVACSSGAGTGLNRRELYTDARDVSSTVDNETLTDAEYKAQLSQRGLENLAENIATKSFEGKVETTRMYRYGEDFFLGDMVQMLFMKKKPRTWRQQILSGKTNGQNGLMHRQKKFNNPIWTGKNSGMIGMRRKRRICKKRMPIGNSYGRPGSTSTRTIIHPKWLHGERTPKLYLMSGSNS